MTAHEVILILLASCVLYLVLAFRDTFSMRNFLLVLCVVPALFLAVEGATEVVTCDETYMLSEISDFQKLTLRQWNLDNFRTSISVVGNIVNALKPLLAANDLQAKTLAKAVHWLLGLVILAGIFWIISWRWIPKNLFAEYFLIYFYSALLLPTNILSLKVANYDMLAMLLGVWGMLCAFVGCEVVKQTSPLVRKEALTGTQKWRSLFSETLLPDGGCTMFGILLATLAAQEKVIAGPILTLVIIVSVLMRLRRRGRIDYWVPIQIGICLLVTFLILLLTHGIVAIWSPPNLPAFDLIKASERLFPHFDILALAIAGRQPNLLTQMGLLVTTVALASMLIWWLRSVRTKVAIGIRLAFPLLIIIAVAVGAVGFYKVEAYVHPIHPIPNGDFVPQDEMNGEILHFLSPTLFQHITRKAMFAYSLYGIALPSAFLLVAILVLGLLRWRRQSEEKGLFSGFEALGVLSSGMPLLYVLTNTPVGARYFNIWIFTQVLLLGILGCRLLASFAHRGIRMFAVAAFSSLLLAEVLPFRPIVAAFWPWWANPLRLQTAGAAEPGKLLAIWPGWGEEAMIAGRQLRKMAESGQLPATSFRLYTIYPGDWLAPGQVTCWVQTAPYRSFTENDYYIVNRAAIVHGQVRLPIDKEPFWIIQYRGMTQAWVFRGSALKNSD